MLSNAVLVVTSAPNLRHQDVAFRLALQLEAHRRPDHGGAYAERAVVARSVVE